MSLIEHLLEDVDFNEDICERIVDDKFDFIEKDKEIGYYTWKEVWKDGNMWVFIDNLFIEPKERNKGNLLFLRKHFRDKFPNAYLFYWYSDKRKNYEYWR